LGQNSGKWIIFKPVKEDLVKYLDSLYAPSGHDIGVLAAEAEFQGSM